MPLRRLTPTRFRKLGLTVLILAILVGVLSRLHWIPSHVKLELDIVIPLDVPESVYTYNKQDVATLERLESLYSPWFVSGWEECLREFVKRRPRDLRSGGLEEFLVPVRPRLKQIDGYRSSADTAGFDQCRRQLEKHCRENGGRATRAALRSRYGEVGSDVHESILRFHPQATAIARKGSGG